IVVRSNGGQVKVDTTGAVINSGRGMILEATNGSVLVDSGSINARNSNGIQVYHTGNDSSSGGTTVNTAAGTGIKSTNSAIVVSEQSTYGGIIITTNGTLESTQGDGIAATISDAGNGSDILIRTNTLVTAYKNGISARSTGNGNVGITSNDQVTAQKGTGINGISGGGAVTITANSDVSGVNAISGTSTGGKVHLIARGKTVGTAANALATGGSVGVALHVSDAKDAVI
ncbi:hypothetical protein, partial [Bacillus anthracis]|uniref:hypothetical protein n=1 Tax=Bacillus anthracis TaxID=1392 RepID=UPI0039A64EA1